MNFNKTLVGGNLTRDPELTYTPKGTAICRISIAVNRTWSNDAGEKKEEVSFFDATAFGRTAEVIGQYFKKGRPIFVEGRLKQEIWEDKNTKEKRSKVVVIVEGFQFVGGDKDQSSSPRPAAAPATSAAPAESENPGDDTEVPF